MKAHYLGILFTAFVLVASGNALGETCDKPIDGEIAVGTFSSGKYKGDDEYCECQICPDSGKKKGYVIFVDDEPIEPFRGSCPSLGLRAATLADAEKQCAPLKKEKDDQ